METETVDLSGLTEDDVLRAIKDLEANPDNDYFGAQLCDDGVPIHNAVLKSLTSARSKDEWYADTSDYGSFEE
jgi:hypothetical protein